jgi:hypothetical protein
MPDSVDDWIDVLINAKNWSAKLAQGDVGPTEYSVNIDYSFQQVMRSVLGIEGGIRP